MESRLLLGDCRDVLAELPAGVADSVVTDPPYELGFMGKAWDASEVTYEIRTWRAILRAVKPGGYLLAFGGTRTSHRLACAIEDAGFEIRDTIAWMYGTGFPKSMDVSKQIDKMVEAKLKRRLSAPSGQWAGWGTALKPAFEPVVVAQRPLMEKTIAGNVMRIGTGALNIDGCRIEGESGDGNWSGRDAHDRGRWPANVILDEAAAEMLDDQTGGSESRFFYSAKASKGERNAGLDGFEERVAGGMSGRADGSFGGDPIMGRNHHPTVKPVALMRYLTRLVTPPGGVVLDPFMGSGSSGIAATLEGFEFVGVERDPEYLKIAEARISNWTPE